VPRLRRSTKILLARLCVLALVLAAGYMNTAARRIAFSSMPAPHWSSGEFDSRRASDRGGRQLFDAGSRPFLLRIVRHLSACARLSELVEV
jgi:hypothetical protein